MMKLEWYLSQEISSYCSPRAWKTKNMWIWEVFIFILFYFSSQCWGSNQDLTHAKQALYPQPYPSVPWITYFYLVFFFFLLLWWLRLIYMLDVVLIEDYNFVTVLGLVLMCHREMHTLSGFPMFSLVHGGMAITLTHFMYIKTLVLTHILYLYSSTDYSQ